MVIVTATYGDGMSSHRFEIGSLVSLNPEGQGFSKESRYIVEAHLPPLGTALQYRIKAEAEGFRRVVVEHQLTALGEAQVIPSSRPMKSHPGEAD